MSCRLLELTLISAIGLEDVRLIGKTEVHARVTVGGDPKTEKRTPTDTHGKTDPAWNFRMRYMVSESSLGNHGARIVIKFYCSRVLGDRYIGEVNTSVRDLYDYWKPGGGSEILTYTVQRGAINSKGKLSLSFKFGDKISVENVPAEGIAV